MLQYVCCHHHNCVCVCVCVCVCAGLSWLGCLSRAVVLLSCMVWMCASIWTASEAASECVHSTIFYLMSESHKHALCTSSQCWVTMRCRVVQHATAAPLQCYMWTVLLLYMFPCTCAQDCDARTAATHGNVTHVLLHDYGNVTHLLLHMGMWCDSCTVTYGNVTHVLLHDYGNVTHVLLHMGMWPIYCYIWEYDPAVVGMCPMFCCAWNVYCLTFYLFPSIQSVSSWTSHVLLSDERINP